MGEVFLAQDLRLGRPLAIKVLPADLARDDRRVARFVQEAKLASSLNHPNVAHIYEIAESGGIHYIAMEYVEGEPLSARIARGPLPLTDILDVAVQVADALDEAHSHGVVHRDIKPANILITLRQQVKVLDFGVAKRMVSAVDSTGNTKTLSPTEPGLILGTVDYMSPEQALGQPVDHRTDVFSFGTLLYELATGRRPFAASSMTATLDRILHGFPDSIARLNDVFPQAFHYIVRKCLEKDASSRYQSARELLIDLQNLRRDSTPGRRAASDARTPRRARRSVEAIAVMPFANAGVDPGADYFSDGITESLINSLSTLPKPRVMARSTVFRFKGREIDPLAIGRELDVQAVVTGRIQSVADDIVVTVELVDTRNGSQLWGGRYSRKLAEIFTVQEEIAQEIADKVRGRLTGEERKRLVKRHTDSAEAYEAYLKGLFHANRRTQEGFARAIEFFTEAIRCDPSYALAHAGLADCHTLMATGGYTGAQRSAPLARHAAEQAMALDPGLPEAHAAVGFVRFRLDWDWERAGQALQRARDLNPGSATVHHRFALLMTVLGRFDEARRSIERAQALDPLSLVIGTAAGRIHHFARRYAEAIKQCRRTLELDPAFVPAHFDLGMAYAETGRLPEAIAQFEQHFEAARERSVMVAVLGYMYGRAGRTEDARRLLADIQERRVVGDSTAYDVNLVLLGLGEDERALDWLERAGEERDGVLVFLKVEPMFDRIRQHPRFIALQRRLNL